MDTFLLYIRIKMFMKEPHTALFVAPTGVGKTHLALSLLENEYRNHFDFIVIICPTLWYNSTYKSRGWVWNDPEVSPIEPGKGLVIINTRDRGGRKYNFFSKKLITHPNFPSNFHTPSENLPELSYPNMYKLLCVDNFYDI